MSKPYVVVESKYSGLDAIKLTEEPWQGIIYAYGKVEFEEDESSSTIHLKFDYEILDDGGKGFTNKQPFETYIGKILEELLHEGIRDNNLTYTGGTEIDANRTKDSEQSDI